MFQLTCEVCKRGFDWPHKKQFCSKKCYKESFLIRNPRRSEKSCNLCGEIKNYKLLGITKVLVWAGWMLKIRPEIAFVKSVKVTVSKKHTQKTQFLKFYLMQK